MKNIIEIKNLSFEYVKNNIILDKLSLEIKENTLNAILGSNGSGKSTLLECLSGINKPLSGEIFINEKLITDYTNKEFAKTVAFIPQSLVINIDYSVSEFILFGRNPYLNIGQSPKNEDYEKCYQYAEYLGIMHLLDKNINKISGGERQLCFICRALLQESKILILDEPLSALDFGNQNKLLKIFKELKNKGKTILFTAHNPNQVIDLGCNVIVLNNKKIESIGLVNDIICLELLQKIYNSEIEITNNHFKFK